jgi:hypothetical protein
MENGDLIAYLPDAIVIARELHNLHKEPMYVVEYGAYSYYVEKKSEYDKFTEDFKSRFRVLETIGDTTPTKTENSKG